MPKYGVPHDVTVSGCNHPNWKHLRLVRETPRQPINALFTGHKYGSKTFTKLEYLTGNQMLEVVESGGVFVNALRMICVRRRSLLCAFALERPRSRFMYDPRLPDYPPACLALICLRIRPGVLDPDSGQRRFYWITDLALLLTITSHSQLQSINFCISFIFVVDIEFILFSLVNTLTTTECVTIYICV